MARLLLIRALLVAGLGALALAGAPGPSFAGGASTGDRWLWPGPPNGDSPLPAFYDLRRGVTSYLQQIPDHVVWSLDPDTPRAWHSLPVDRSYGLEYTLPHAYDAAGDRVLFLSSSYSIGDTCCAGTWHLEGWQLHLGSAPLEEPLPSLDKGPAGRDGMAMVYDSRRKRILAIGGREMESDRYPTQVAALDANGTPAAWTEFDPNAPGLQALDLSAIYDSVTDQVITYGGRDTLRGRSRAVHALSLSNPVGWQTWSLPDSMTLFEALTFDPQIVPDIAHRRLLLVNAHFKFPGDGIPIDSYEPDSAFVWALDLDTHQGWTPIPYVGPSPDVTAGHVSYDPVRDRLSIYGCAYRNDLFELVLDGHSAWTQPQRSDVMPQFTTNVTALVDRKHGRLLYLDMGNRLWTATRGILDDWELADRWGAPPSRRYATAVFDSVGQRGILYGGGGADYELGDVWQFTVDDTNGVKWQRLFPEGEAPTPRWGAAAVYDPVGHRMVMFGGYAGHALGDTWELRLDPPVRWHRLPDRGLPPAARFFASAVYDSRRGAMILYGGNKGSLYQRALTDETWALSFTDGDVWVPVTALGMPPAPRFGHNAVYDSRRDRMIVFWGYSYNGGRIDCAELDLADGPAWRNFSPSGPTLRTRAEFTAVYDPDRDQALIFGGQPVYPDINGAFPFNVYADFTDNPVQAPPPVTGPPLAMLGLAPNPSRDMVNLAFDLPTDTEVQARIYDAGGRLVRDLGRKSYIAGRHLLVWDGKNAAGAVPASGVYFARLTVLGKNFSGKFVLLR